MKPRFTPYILSLIILFITCGLYSAWIDNVPNQLTQPDGTVIDVLYSGDEFHKWPHDKDGYTMIIEVETGNVCWAVAKDGDLVSTGKPVHLHSPQSLGLSPRENISMARYQEKRRWFDEALIDNPHRTPSLGHVTELVIFIRFADDPEFTSQVSYYNSLFNTTGTGVNSLKQYYYDASYGQLTVDSPFFPTPPGNTIVSYQDTQPRGYFQPYSASNPIGYLGGENDYERKMREHRLLKRAAEAIASQVPTNINLDVDNDGRVDNVNYIFRGSYGDWNSLLWPHRWWLDSETAMIRGKRVWDYNFNIENHMTSSGVSVLAHEFGHSLGAPDYYRYPGQSEPGTPVGTWDLMASDQNPPQSMSAYTKWYYMGWVDSIPRVTANTSVTLYPNSINRDQHAIRINSPNSATEYFVVEYRSRNTGLIDSTISGSGLVVWRVNPARAGHGNDTGPPDELYVFRYNGTPTSDGAISLAYLSAQSGLTSINDLTNPRTYLSNGLPGGLNIRNIGTAGESITFYVDVAGANPNDIDETFESQTFSSHDWIVGTVNPWTITSDSAQNGTYSATSASMGDNQISRLELKLNHAAGYVQFYLRTSTQQNGDFLRFYADDRLLQSWSGNTNWTRYSVYLSAGIHKLVWQYEKDQSGYSGQDKVWIDTIGFPDIVGHILYPPRNLSISSVERNISLSWTSPFVTTIPNPPNVVGYNVYRNGTLVTPQPVTAPSFETFSTGGYNVSFTTTTVYSTGESEPSNSVNHSSAFAPATNLRGALEGNGVRLNWDYGYPLDFVIGFRVIRNGSIINQPSVDGHLLTYLDRNIPTSGSYTYTIRVLYTTPTGVALPSNEYTVQYVSEGDYTTTTAITMLKYNYPNPFNPQTQIHFSLAKDSDVRLDIFNIKGEIVKTLINSQLSAGNHHATWNGYDSLGKPVSSGVYFYKMETPEYSSVKKMILMK